MKVASDAPSDRQSRVVYPDAGYNFRVGGENEGTERIFSLPTEVKTTRL